MGKSLHEIVEESRRWREIIYVDYAKYRLDNNYNIPEGIGAKKVTIVYVLGIGS